MKYFKLKYLPFIVALLILPFAFYSCGDTNDDDSQNANAPAIHKVFLENANSTVPDREVTFARLGQTIRLEGENFVGMTKVIINGYSCYFNPVFVSNKSMIVQINQEVPTIDAADAVKNTIRLEKGAQFCVYNFDIRSASPSVTNISHTMPLPGEWITVEGTGLQEVSRVVFPGDIEVTTDIVSDEDGKFFNVIVPAGVSENGGSIFVESVNGGAYSPAYFNCKAGLILDFDGHGEPASWTDNAVTSDDFLSDIIGQGNVSQGNYCPMIPGRLAPVSAGAPRVTEVWTSGNEDWRSQFVPAYFNESTSLEKIALQFDIYVPENWNDTGFLGICLANNFSAGNQWTGEFYNYIPWLAGSAKAPFKTLGWTTVTIPMNKFYKYSDGQYTFADILAFREGQTYRNFGVFFNNNDFNLKNVTGKDADESVEFPSSATSVNVFVDNFRLVSLDTPVYSDFPDEE
ncbi:MAG: glycan-binding surface protein [Dysgonamonadaceae bacterium]|jgi:hypothetical protein|nr:glycan-binding surface protein [Dysgonamonadaceae bacterium]